MKLFIQAKIRNSVAALLFACVPLCVQAQVSIEGCEAVEARIDRLAGVLNGLEAGAASSDRIIGVLTEQLKREKLAQHCPIIKSECVAVQRSDIRLAAIQRVFEQEQYRPAEILDASARLFCRNQAHFIVTGQLRNPSLTKTGFQNSCRQIRRERAARKRHGGVVLLPKTLTAIDLLLFQIDKERLDAESYLRVCAG